MLDNFDPNGPGMNNGNFIGLPFTKDNAQLILFPIPWDVTVSYADGTSGGPSNILQASTQLDLMHSDSKDAWKKGLFFLPENTYWKKRNLELRPDAKKYIQFIEDGGKVEGQKTYQKILDEINYSCQNLNHWVEQESTTLLKAGKIVGLIGGDHSSPLGYLKALAKQHDSFGILQMDAHMDLRAAYEGFQYSHASISYNALKIPQIEKLIQVGIRDYCEVEFELAQEEERIAVFFDHDLKKAQFQGKNWHDQCLEIIELLPKQVYISFDIDALEPAYCPNTGTPVPGGLSYEKAAYLISLLVNEGHHIIGFDLCEVAGTPHEWDGNVGARMAYHLAISTLRSNNIAEAKT